MEQRDLLKDQIEQFGRILAKILSNFMGLKSAGNVAQAMEITNQQLQGELDIDVAKLLTMSKVETIEFARSRKLSADHLESLSDYFKEMGMALAHSNKVDGKKYLEKAIELLDVADEISETKSMERMNKKTSINILVQRDV